MNINFFVGGKFLEKDYLTMVRTGFIDSDVLTDNDIRRIFSEDSAIIYKGGLLCYVDKQGIYKSFLNGKRHTTGQPAVYDNKIHVFGDSRPYSPYSEDRYTLCSQLQALINQNGLRYCVENDAIQGLKIPGIVSQIKNTELKKDDLVFLLINLNIANYAMLFEFVIDAHRYCVENEILLVLIDEPAFCDRIRISPWEEYYLQPILLPDLPETKERYTANRMRFQYDCIRDGILFYNVHTDFYDSKHTIFLEISHWGDYGNSILANQFLKIIQMLHYKNDNENNYCNKIQMEREFLEYVIQKTLPGCDKYIAGVLKHYTSLVEGKKCGAVVMNCNPFTKGHRYLIEQALKSVDLLFVFIVQENRSMFSFDERIHLVKENTKDLTNVTVFPGGNFIISSVTFPSYFTKEFVTDQKPDVMLDLLMFAFKIAPLLHITIRFVGEEPYCAITKHYNEQMKSILPKYGIDVVEIARMETKGDNDIISASKVRLLINGGKFDVLEKYVPDITLAHLKKRALTQKL